MSNSSVPVSSPSTSLTTPSDVVLTTTTFSTFTPSISSNPPSTSTPAPVTTPLQTPPQSLPPTSTTPPVQVTSFITISQTSNGTPQIVVITSTATAQAPPTQPNVQSSSASSAASTSSSNAPAATADASAQSSSGLSGNGKIAIAVVVPIAAVALLVLAALFFFRKRRQRKNEEELRKKELEEYGFNPNNDPALPAVGLTSPHGDDLSEMRETDGAGYRGWGNTSTARKTSTTLSGGAAGAGIIGLARSTSGSDPGGYAPNSSTTTPGTAPNSDVQSGDPLVGRPTSADSETIGALGAAPAAMGNRQDRSINRGPSNASSAYSAGAARSQNSDEGPLPSAMSSPQHYNDALSYDEGIPQHGPYGDGTYGGGQPIVQNVQARRATRIENPSVFPQQGSTGIAQNF